MPGHRSTFAKMVTHVKSNILQEWEKKTGMRQYLEHHLKCNKYTE